MATHEGALAGMTVLDLTQVMAGPFCTMILADLGADVVKVENPESGDQTRSSFAHPGAFRALNRNKKSVTIDLRQRKGGEILRKLLATADVFSENFKTGAMERLGRKPARPRSVRASRRAGRAGRSPDGRQPLLRPGLRGGVGDPLADHAGAQPGCGGAAGQRGDSGGAPGPPPAPATRDPGRDPRGDVDRWRDRGRSVR